MSVPDQLVAGLAERYSIERELGAGGMATVYLARDLRHDRKVALKVLKPDLAAVFGAERFLAEIRTTANLQHPHILPLHDSGQVGGTVFYVMPFVEGETLRDRLTRETQLPVEEALQIAVEVADALDYAHGQGVIHRDIKPENILLQGGHAAVADFGIALAASSAGGSRMTETGMSLGTPSYMSPEQAMGERTLDARTDIYALGATVYEMLAGEPPFTGPTAQAIVAKVMTEPPASLVSRRSRVSQQVEAAIFTALEKLPADRFGSAAEFARALMGQGTTAARPAAIKPPAPARALPWLVAAVGVAVGAWGWLRPPDPTERLLRVPLRMEAVGRPNYSGATMALSPNGRTLVYSGAGASGGFQLFERRFDTEALRPIPATEGASGPFFSPDGAFLVFQARGKLWKTRLDGSVRPSELANVEATEYFGGSWGLDGRIVVALRGSLYLIDPAGGSQTPFVAPEPGGFNYLVAPWWGADGRHVLATVRSNDGEWRAAVITVKDRKVSVLPSPARQVFLVRDRWLVYVDPVGSLFRVEFDFRRLAPRGEPERIAEGVGTTFLLALAAANRHGDIAYFGGGTGLRELVMVDRSGQAEPLGLAPASWRHPRFSPDGNRVAVGIEARGSRGDIWVIDLSTRRPARVTFDSLGVHPAWSSDGRFVLFSRIVGSVAGIGRVRADGSGTPETALAWPRNIWEAEQTPDGRTVLFRDDNSATVRDIYWAPAESLASAKLLLGSPLNERTIAIAPDGKYFAYLSNASGGDEVYLRRLAEDSPTWPVTSGGGASEPRWARNGRELFFRRGDSLYAVPVTLGAEPRVGEARALFGGRYESSIYHSYYDVAPDGRHFLMVRPQGAEGGPVIHLVLGLFDQR